MPRIRVLPNPALCPGGVEFDARAGVFLCDALLRHGITLEHACDKACACATCHVHVRAGGEALDAPAEEEEDQLDKAWGVDADSRLACQVIVRHADLVVELPRYTRNHAAENH